MKSFISIDHKICQLLTTMQVNFILQELKTWLKAKKIFSKKSSIIEIPHYQSVDINTKED